MNIDLSTLFALPEGLNKDLTMSIFSAIKEQSKDGMDYIKFKQSVKNLQNMDMDETTSFKSAYATASTLGMSKEELVQSANSYKTVVNKKRDEFIEAMQKGIAEKVTLPTQKVGEMENEIKKIDQKIKELELQKTEYAKLIEATKEDIVEADAKIDSRKAEFVLVYDAFNAILDKDMQQLSNLL
jgi:chromosome segregation ATPase